MLVDNSLLAILDRSPVHRDSRRIFQAKFRAFFYVVVDLGVKQQGLGRNTADMQTGAAEVWVFLDQRGLQAQLTRANGGGVSGRAAADDGYVINGVRQSSAPLYRLKFRGMNKQMIVNEERTRRNALGRHSHPSQT